MSETLPTPFINLDKFLDIQSLIAQKKAIDLAIARSIDNRYFAGWTNYINLENDYPSWMAVYQERKAEFPELENLRHNEKAMFLLLNQECVSFCDFIEVYRQNTKRFDERFDMLFDWIEAQKAFSSIDNIYVFLNSEGKHSIKHVDTRDGSDKRQMIWISLDKRKQFFVEVNGQRILIEDHCVAFQPCYPHGSLPDLRMSYSLRYEGIFTPEFLDKIGLKL